ncbi:MAG: hypothetical protein IJ833_04360 [Lachnospiraceae bacterium]|nr:hypothetical protein [Lachnospiraceae bacterium]
MKKFILFFVILVSAICTFATLMVYLQSGYEREHSTKMTAIITEVGAVEREVISRPRVYVEKYYQDIVIEYEKNGERIETYCSRVMTELPDGYAVGEEIQCYVDDYNHISFSYSVRDNLSQTIVSGLVCAGAIYLFSRVNKKADVVE